MSGKVAVCDNCNAGIANDDWTWVDVECCCNTAQRGGHRDDCSAEATYARILSGLEQLGCLTRVGEADEPGYFNCDLCWEIQCGGGHVWVSKQEEDNDEVSF